jgi:ribosomal protein L14E/L6E/L27E
MMMLKKNNTVTGTVISKYHGKDHGDVVVIRDHIPENRKPIFDPMSYRTGRFDPSDLMPLFPKNLLQ